MVKILSNDEINKLLETRIILFRGDYIYDVTDFTEHPGTYQVLINIKGKDISNDYKFHRNKKIFKKYLVGKRQSSNCVIS